MSTLPPHTYERRLNHPVRLGSLMINLNLLNACASTVKIALSRYKITKHDDSYKSQHPNNFKKILRSNRKKDILKYLTS